MGSTGVGVGVLSEIASGAGVGVLEGFSIGTGVGVGAGVGEGAGSGPVFSAGVGFMRDLIEFTTRFQTCCGDSLKLIIA
jgi:hypothetical protein